MLSSRGSGLQDVPSIKNKEWDTEEKLTAVQDCTQFTIRKGLIYLIKN